jgi:hypothetical protein
VAVVRQAAKVRPVAAERRVAKVRPVAAEQREVECDCAVTQDFWFDLLNKFIVVSSTVKPKKKSPEQKSKD